VHLNIRLIGRLTEFERSDGVVTFAHRASIIEVLSVLGIPHDQVGPVSLNGSIVSKERWGTTALSEGDELTVMPPIKGG
jgi:thiamine biosynthesis protein ThiS